MPSDAPSAAPPAAADAATTASDPPAETASDAPTWDRERLLHRLPTILLLGYVVVAFPVLLFGYGRYHWFFRDEWMFFTERMAIEPASYFEPFNVHPAAGPVLVYQVLWNVFGIDSYRPYQAVVIALHLTAVVLLHRVMRRSGVRPWLAAAYAAVFVLYGPGDQNILWAFQVGFSGALVLGLTHLLLADHDGPLGRRDAVAVLAGIGAVMTAGVGPILVVVTAATVLLRRGWRAAAALSAPVAAVYLAWYLIEHADSSGPLGSPTTARLAEWIWWSVSGTFVGIGHHRILAVVAAALAVGGLAWAWAAGLGRWRRGDHAAWRATRGRLAAPTSMLVGSVLWAATTGWGRWFTGFNGSRADRYVHIATALALPAVAVGAEQVARRWRATVPVLVVLALIPLPPNADALRPEVFGRPYMEDRERIITNAVRVPFAREVPRDVQPIADAYDGELTIGWLLDAYDAGKLAVPDHPISPALENELRVRLGLAQRSGDPRPTPCTDPDTEAGDLRLDRGDEIVIRGPVRVVYLDDGGPASRPVPFETRDGTRLVAELDGLTVRVTAPAPSAGYCAPS